MRISKRKRGFTLIELLVVIAIIGILAGIVLVSVSGARNRAKDARVTADMDQVRTQAVVLNDSNGNYGNLYCSVSGNPCTCLDSTIGKLCTDVNQNASSTSAFTVYIAPTSASTSYCAYAYLLGSKQLWCVDSDLLSIATSSIPTSCTAACVAAGSCKCQP